MITSSKRFLTQHFIVIGCCIFMLFLVFAAFNDRVANAFAPSWKYQVAIGATESHRTLTDQAMRSLAKKFFNIDKLTNPMEYAIIKVSDANEEIDKNQKSASWHVDGESFSDAQDRILECANSVKHFLHNPTVDRNSRVRLARDWLGNGLHTIQDFYSHSNWVEMHWPGAAPVHPQFGRLNQSISGLSRQTPTCVSCSTSTFCNGNILCPNNLLDIGDKELLFCATLCPLERL